MGIFIEGLILYLIESKHQAPGFSCSVLSMCSYFPQVIGGLRQYSHGGFLQDEFVK